MLTDVAWGQIQGNRKSQQDAVVCLSWPTGSHLLLLADGMGGHVGGEVASRTVVESFRDAFIQASDLGARDRLLAALQVSNFALFDRVTSEPDLEGMGTTLIAATIKGDALNWVSVGDSPMWLLRNHEFRRLNAIHTVGAVLDERVTLGQQSEYQETTGMNRSDLVEAVCGQDINWVDAPSSHFSLRPDDRLLLASDGVETCSNDVLREIADAEDGSSADIVEAILREVEKRAGPAQDNSTVIAVRLVVNGSRRSP